MMLRRGALSLASGRARPVTRTRIVRVTGSTIELSSPGVHVLVPLTGSASPLPCALLVGALASPGCHGPGAPLATRPVQFAAKLGFSAICDWYHPSPAS